MTPLSVAYHVFVEDGFDSGYFYFKYPVGHQLLLAALELPVVAVAALTGGLSGIESDYPYGFSDPGFYLSAMALVTRLLSAVLGALLVVLVGVIGARICGRAAGLAAALVAAGSYPVIFYSHTSNVEIAYLFWAFLGLYATVRALEDGGPRWYWVVGGTAAMGVSTKEQISGFFALLPLLILLVNWIKTRNDTDQRFLPRGAVGGAISCAGVLLLVNAAFYNPSGYLNRWRFLTHTLPAEIRERYSSYEFPIDFSSSWSLAEELSHMGETLAAMGSSLGWPACALGFAGLGLLVARRGYRSLYLLAPMLGYYFVSLRVLKQVEIRYTMPLSTLLAIPAGYLLALLWERGRAWRPMVVALLLGGLVYSGEVLHMLTHDARYQAEEWMQPRLEQGQSVEVYQRWTYLPRWQYSEGVSRVGFDDISIAGLRQRNPDLVVLSSKAVEGMVMYPNPDWRDGRGMMLESAANREFLDALQAGELGYRQVAEFKRPALIPRQLITSLDPSVVVFERVQR